MVQTRRALKNSLTKPVTPPENVPQPEVHDENDSTPTEADSSQQRKRRRLHTPDGYEDVTIVPSMVTMFELSSRSRRVGKLSERERKMREIDWNEINERRREEANKMAFGKGVRATLPKDDREESIEGESDSGDIDAQIAKAARGNRHEQKEPFDVLEMPAVVASRIRDAIDVAASSRV